MRQPCLPQRHPHVLCSLACLISQRSLAHHHTDMKKEYCLFIQQPTVKPHAQAQCSIWAMPLTIINICLVCVNKLWLCHTEPLGGFACQAGLLSILLQMASATRLLSCPEQRRQRKQRLYHTVLIPHQSVSQSVTSDDVLVGCKTALSGVGLKWGHESGGKVGGEESEEKMAMIRINRGMPITWYPKHNYIKLIIVML